jgi:hypothetical protein
LALSRSRQEEQELHDDIKGPVDDNHFYGKCFFGKEAGWGRKMEAA